MKTLMHYGCGVVAEGSRLLVPVCRENSQMVGYYSVPLLDAEAKVITIPAKSLYC